MAITATIPINSVPIGKAEQGGNVTINPEWNRFFRDLQVRSGGAAGILSASGGGTGYSVFTAGDILYADTAESLARLNAAAAGNVLLAGVSPAWGKVGLTTHVDGILAQANGGTGFEAFSPDLSAWLQEATSANLLAATTDPNGTGQLVFSIGAIFEAPILGTPASGNLSNCTGYLASALAGTALPVGIITSSLTSVGTLAELTVTAPIVGSVTGSSGSTTGNAATATLAGAALVLATPRLIGGTAFDGSADIAVALATAATALATPRAINGVNFDGSAAITVTAAAGTLSGNTLAAGVTASSLTSVGTLASLALAGAVTGVTDITTTGNTILGNASTDTLNVGNGGLVKDAAGNFGLGTSAYTLASALQLGRVTSFAHDINSGYLGAGWIGTSAPNYAVTGNYAVRTVFNSALGSINFQTAGTGTAGNAVTFTDKMILDNNGQLAFQIAGKGISIKAGANCKLGVATLVAGVAVVSNTSVTATSRIQLTVQSLGTVAVPQAIGVTARTAGTSFTITSASITDTSVVAWLLVEES